MFAPADYVLRPLTGDDEVVLWEMLYQALSPPEGEAPSREMMQRPEYARYVEGWGRPAKTRATSSMTRKGERFSAQFG